MKRSGGEKQRIAIARAIRKNPPIMIFDEAGAALDTRAKAAVMRFLLALSQSRTTLIIAHRLSTVAGVERIVVMECGQLVEQGPRLELLARGAVYAGLRAQPGSLSETAAA